MSHVTLAGDRRRPAVAAIAGELRFVGTGSTDLRFRRLRYRNEEESEENLTLGGARLEDGRKTAATAISCTRTSSMFGEVSAELRCTKLDGT